MAHKLKKITRAMTVYQNGGTEFPVSTFDNVYRKTHLRKKLEITIPEDATPGSNPECYCWKIKCEKSDRIELAVRYDHGIVRVAHKGRPAFRPYTWNGKSLREARGSDGVPLTYGQQADIARALSTIRF